MNLNEFITWQKEKPETRTVSIKISPFSHEPKGISVWVYDYKLLTGQYVTSVAGIDLEGTHRAEKRAEFEKLKKELGE